jgi:hypothetical protein
MNTFIGLEHQQSEQVQLPVPAPLGVYALLPDLKDETIRNYLWALLMLSCITFRP